MVKKKIKEKKLKKKKKKSLLRRVCRRCNEMFIPNGKTSKICDNCNKSMIREKLRKHKMNKYKYL